MRTRALTGSLVLAAVVGLASSAVAQDAGAKTVDAAWVKAMKANDLDALVACYASDAVMWFPGAPEARGTAAIRAIYASYFAQFNVSDAVLTPSYATSGDVSGAWGDYVLTLAPKKGGAPEILKGRFTSVSKKIGGKWMYVADQASATPPPPPPAAAK